MVRNRQQYHIIKQNIHRPILSQAKSSNNTAILATCVGMTAVAAIYNSSQQRHQSSQAEKKKQSNNEQQYLEMYLMDRIAKKPYLNYHSTPSSVYQRQTTRNDHHRGGGGGYRQIDEEEHINTNSNGIPITNNSNGNRKTRPKGVPSRLRLLTIDVPQFKEEAFYKSGVCKLPSEIFDTDQPSFVDGVAPPKKPMNPMVNSMATSGGSSSRKPIVQKSLANQLYYCYNPSYNNPTSNNNDKSTSDQSSKKTKQTASSSSSASQEKQQPRPQPIIGVEILESSIMKMNPNNIRRTYTSVTRDNWRKRTYKYDPGKYTEGNNANDDDVDDNDESGVADAEEDELQQELKTIEQKATPGKRHLTQQPPRVLPDTDNTDTDTNNNSQEIDIDNPNYELHSPWNQHAYLEELYLRTNGMVPFGSPMTRASLFSRYASGHIYRHSAIPPSRAKGGWWLGWLRKWNPVLWSGSHAIGSEVYRASLDGVDGEGEFGLYGCEDGGNGGKGGIFGWGLFPWMSSSKKKVALNRASNKPHAVICDGAAMQRVPGSLRYLTKICREAQIPLYILNDPRSWGSQTHSTLEDALVDLRKTVSDNVIQNALALREGSAFERGRFVGQLEKEMAWQAYDAARKTRDALMDARRRLRMDKVEDWGGLTEEQLRAKLTERRVMVVRDGEEEEGKDDDGGEEGVKYSDAFLAICRQCLGTESKDQPTADKPK